LEEKMQLEWLIIPLVSALIGYIATNIAVRMFMRPLNAGKTGQAGLSFIAGQVAGKEDQTSNSPGDMAGKRLLSKKVLVAALTSEEVRSGVLAMFDAMTARLAASELSTAQALSKRIKPDQLQNAISGLKKWLTDTVVHKVSNMEIGKMAADEIISRIENNGRLALFGFYLADKIHLIRAPLANLIDSAAQSSLPSVVSNALDKEMDKLLTTPVKDLCAQVDPLIATARQMLIGHYDVLVDSISDAIVSNLSLDESMKERIGHFGLREIENAFIRLLKRKQKIVVWAGSALCFAVGVMNMCLFYLL
jgi:uncharacterized membrane protein YheB (UPF0754 family)